MSVESSSQPPLRWAGLERPKRLPRQPRRQLHHGNRAVRGRRIRGSLKAHVQAATGNSGEKSSFEASKQQSRLVTLKSLSSSKGLVTANPSLCASASIGWFERKTSPTR